MSSHAAPRSRPVRASGVAALRRPSPATWTTLGVGAILAAVAFAANGGLRLGETTSVEMALLLGCGTVGAVSVVATADRGRWWGMGAAALFLVLAGWTALSIAWAVNPSDAWIETNRTIAYVAVFAAAVALVRLLPGRWESVLGGIVLATFLVCGWALLTKVFPGTLSADELYARLRAPFGYWNATGLYAALGVPACVWLGARRHGHGPLNALAFPVLGLLLVTLLLSYSRGALLALIVAMVLWFAVASGLRLRGAAVLLIGAAGAVPVGLWAFGQDALTTDRLPVALRAGAGHEFGGLIAVMLVLLLAVGLAVAFREARTPLASATRRQIGTTLVVVVALVPVGIGVYLATTDRGFTGQISHGWTTLTDPNASTPPNDPSRLTAIGSVRSRYWDEALRMWRDHPWVGVGAEGYATVRPFYRRDTLEVRHAHGFVVQTLADLGIIGLALALAALAAWIVAALRATGLDRRRGRPRPLAPEQLGLVTMCTIVVVFGVHSFVDWTWFIPGCTVLALLCAGWVAGRGPLGDGAPAALRGPRAWLRAPYPLAGGVAVLATAVVAAAVVWQPLRSLDASNDALAKLEAGDVAGAERAARTAHDRNPLSLDPLSVLAVAQSRAGDTAGALATLQREVRLQPANPETWVRLADFQFNKLDRPRDALRSLRAALYLDPRNPQIQAGYLAVLRSVRESR